MSSAVGPRVQIVSHRRFHTRRLSSKPAARQAWRLYSRETIWHCNAWQRSFTVPRSVRLNAKDNDADPFFTERSKVYGSFSCLLVRDAGQGQVPMCRYALHTWTATAEREGAAHERSRTPFGRLTRAACRSLPGDFLRQPRKLGLQW